MSSFLESLGIIGSNEPLIAPGTTILHGEGRWIVGAVGVTVGERYYWLVRGGDVAMVPAVVLAEEASLGRKATA